mmetsp:Transcript_14215/g.14320  ORF Transcript_14215/g.14320 Transcript_14215/m.14320 type:complete len:177 (-) Transcript_14215:61-591(-)
MISCEDMDLWHSVWRSSEKALVGLYPRLHRVNERHNPTVSSQYEYDFQFLGPMSVWWRGKYSLMLPSAVMMHRRYLQEISTNSSHTVAFNRLVEIVANEPACSEMVLQVWSVYLQAPAPIWIDIEKKISTKSSYKSTQPNYLSRSMCLSLLCKVLDIKDFEYTTFKSVRASTQLVW